MPKRLTLKDAVKAGNLAGFIAQEEGRVPKGADKSRFDKAVKAAVKSQQSKRQTSRSQGDGGSREKRTR